MTNKGNPNLHQGPKPDAFKAGDKAILNVGGPCMSVRLIFRDEELGTLYECVWFDGHDQLQEGRFPEDCLIRMPSS